MKRLAFLLALPLMLALGLALRPDLPGPQTARPPQPAAAPTFRAAAHESPATPPTGSPEWGQPRPSRDARTERPTDPQLAAEVRPAGPTQADTRKAEPIMVGPDGVIYRRAGR
jgi:hypothetical protein